MSHFNVEVSTYMSSPVRTIAADASLEAVYAELEKAGVSSLAVVEGAELVGVVTRTDLLRLGQRQSGNSRQAKLLTFPNQTVAEVMSAEPVTVAPGDTIDKAADLMSEGRFHRIYVCEDGKPVGVLSTRDIMLAIRDKRLNKPISTFMSSPVFTVRASEPISLATERLEKARVSGLVVVDERWPVGVFTQSVALAARHLPRETPVEEAMSSAMLLLDPETPVFRAAGQAAVMEVRRVVAWDGKAVQGILTGLDFARVAAPSATRR